MKLNDVPNNCQPKSQAALSVRRRLVGLAKAIKSIGEELRIHTYAGIRHLYLDMALGSSELEGDSPPLGRKLHGVREQVPHDLLEPVRVATDIPVHRIQINIQPDAFGGCGQLDIVLGSLDDAVQVNRSHIEIQFAGDDARDIEKILDELGLQPRISLDCFVGLVLSCLLYTSDAADE